jgi:hypothetical protein
MLVGKSCGANDASRRQGLPQGSMEQAGTGPHPGCAETGPDDFLKISVSGLPVTIWQAIKVTKWSTFTGDFEP